MADKEEKKTEGLKQQTADDEKPGVLRNRTTAADTHALRGNSQDPIDHHYRHYLYDPHSRYLNYRVPTDNYRLSGSCERPHHHHIDGYVSKQFSLNCSNL